MSERPPAASRLLLGSDPRLHRSIESRVALHDGERDAFLLVRSDPAVFPHLPETQLGLIE
jgi:hypothetical protein